LLVPALPCVPVCGYEEPGARPRGSRLGRCECQHDRQGKKHRAHLVVPVGVSLVLRQLDLPSRQDLVALEAFANTGQSLIELGAVGSEKGDGEKQSGSELLGVRRPIGRLQHRDLHDQRFRRLVSRLQAEMPVDCGLQLGSVRRIGHRAHLVPKTILLRDWRTRVTAVGVASAARSSAGDRCRQYGARCESRDSRRSARAVGVRKTLKFTYLVPKRSEVARWLDRGE